MSEPRSVLEQDEQDLLHSALAESTAFTPGSLKRQSVTLPSSQPDFSAPSEVESQITASEEAVLAPDSGQDAHDAWKAEYEAQIATFKAQNAVQREKAERERARWEQIRAQEESERAEKGGDWHEVRSPGSAGGSLSASTITGTGSNPSLSVLSSPSPADVRDLTAGEGAREERAHAADQHQKEDSGTDSGSGSHPEKWEMPSSMTSSFPSSLDMDTPPSPGSQHHLHPRHYQRTQPSEHDRHRPGRAPIPLPPPLGGAEHAPAQRGFEGDSRGRANEPISATLSVFNPALPFKTRVFALVSSLAINLMLPFVNGVMLGFGEIFAKEVVAVWIGWPNFGVARPARPAATNVGLGVPLPGERRDREKERTRQGR